MYKNLLLLIICLLVAQIVSAQNYTSIGNGNWNNAANWSKAEDWATPIPPNNGYGSRNLNHNQVFTGNFISGSASINVASGKTLTINGNFQNSSQTNIYGTVNVSGDFQNTGGGVINITGSLVVEGNAIVNARINIEPGGKLIAKNNLQVNASNYLYIGNNEEPEPYADLIIYGDLNATGSGDVFVERNGRVAVFGDVNDNNGGGTILRVNNGGQMYVDGDINYSGGGSNIQNNNSESPFGLYVNGEISNTGGGSGTTANVGDQETLINNNPDFFDWLSGIENGPLPIELKSFTAKENSNSIQLEWVTAKEENFSHFEVERSMDMINFDMIGLVQGQGESLSDVSYDLNDSDAPFGVIYYRLKAVDIDDTFDYSPVVKIEKGFKGQLSVYPNPTEQNGHLKITLPSNFQEDIDHLAIYDMQGAKMQEFFTFNPSKELSIDHKIKAGLYFLKIQHNGLEENIRILIR